MKKIAIIAALAASTISTAAFAAPGDTATATGAASAEVVTPITIDHVVGASLNFGKFTTGTTGGTIVVDQTGAAVADTDVTLLSDSVESADEFDVAGDDGRTFDITATGGDVTETGGDTMAFTTDAPATGTLTGGVYTLNVGGTLTVVGGETAGTYSGSYDVTVAYN